MNKLTELVLEAQSPNKDELVNISFNAKCQITGRFNEILQLSGDEDDWESFITRVRKQLAKVRMANGS